MHALPSQLFTCPSMDLPVHRGVPSGGDHQVNRHVHRNDVCHQLLVTEHCPQQTLPEAGNESSRAVKVVDPARERFSPGACNWNEKGGRVRTGVVVEKWERR